VALDLGALEDEEWNAEEGLKQWTKFNRPEKRPTGQELVQLRDSLTTSPTNPETVQKVLLSLIHFQETTTKDLHTARWKLKMLEDYVAKSCMEAENGPSSYTGRGGTKEPEYIRRALSTKMLAMPYQKVRIQEKRSMDSPEERVHREARDSIYSEFSSHWEEQPGVTWSQLPEHVRLAMIHACMKPPLLWVWQQTQKRITDYLAYVKHRAKKMAIKDSQNSTPRTPRENKTLYKRRAEGYTSSSKMALMSLPDKDTTSIHLHESDEELEHDDQGAPYNGRADPKDDEATGNSLALFAMYSPLMIHIVYFTILLLIYNY
jgi:hypothetical protein